MCALIFSLQSAHLFLQESRFVMGPKSRRGVFSARPSTASQIYDTANIPTATTNTPISPTPVGATSNMSFSMTTRIPKVKTCLLFWQPIMIYSIKNLAVWHLNSYQKQHSYHYHFGSLCNRSVTILSIINADLKCFIWLRTLVTMNWN